MKWFDIQNINDRKLTLFSLFIAIVASFILYGNTLGHSYALDDAIVITKNEFTKAGISGFKDILTTDSFTGFFGKQKKLVQGGRYRPLSLLTFAIEYQFFGANPFVGHFVNVLLYAILVWLIFGVSYKLLMRVATKQKAFYTGLLTAFVFLVHPIHTEVVANIKGRDEILSLFFALLAMFSALKYLEEHKPKHIVISALALFLGCFAKENAITFVVIIPLGFFILLVIPKKDALVVFASLLLPAIVFVGIRNSVLGGFSLTEVSELMNNPFLGASAYQKYATILFTFLLYLKLLVFPHPLTFDYYPYQIQLHTFNEGIVWLALAFVMLVLFFLIISVKRNKMIAFGILGFILSFSVVSNVFFPVGVFMSERFVFMPSYFWSLVLAYLMLKYVFNAKQKAVKISIYSLMLMFSVFYSIKTVARNTVWKDDLTLFVNDVKISTNSAKSNCSAGGKLWEQGKKEANEKVKENLYKQSEHYLNRAIEIYPDYSDAWLLLGNLLFDSRKDIEGSVKCYLEVLRRQSLNENAWNNMDIVLQNADDKSLQLKYYLIMNKISGSKYIVNYRLGVLYGRYFGDLTNAITYLEKAISIDNNKLEAIKDLGTAYGMMGNNKKAYDQFKKAVAINAEDYQLLINLSVAARNIGKIEESEQYLKLYESKNKK